MFSKFVSKINYKGIKPQKLYHPFPQKTNVKKVKNTKNEIKQEIKPIKINKKPKYYCEPCFKDGQNFCTCFTL